MIYITCRGKSEAMRISRHLLELRVVACVNMFPVMSMYWWGGNINEENEFVLLAKTSDEKLDRVKEEIMKVHTYDIPCILKLDVEANDEFLGWVERETG